MDRRNDELAWVDLTNGPGVFAPLRACPVDADVVQALGLPAWPTTVADELEEHREHRHEHDTDRHQREIVLDDGDVSEEDTCAQA